jgi:hypothetical protein
LAFLNKGSGIANVTGEKLTEHQIVAAMSVTLAALGRTLSTFSLAPFWEGRQPYYGLLIEEAEFSASDAEAAFAVTLDDELQRANCEYATKRQTDRLGPVRVRRLPAGTWAAWRESRLAKTGGSMEQYKHPCLLPDAASVDGLPILA